jgi:hypothetical protein
LSYGAAIVIVAESRVDHAARALLIEAIIRLGC